MRLPMFVLVCLLISGNIAFAEEDLFDTGEAAAYLEKGIKNIHGKNLDEAVSALEEAVNINPNAEAYYFLGYAYYLKGRAGDAESRKKSIENFERAYELEPGYTPTRYKPENMPPETNGTGQEPAATAPDKQVLEPSTPAKMIETSAGGQQQQ